MIAYPAKLPAPGLFPGGAKSEAGTKKPRKHQPAGLYFLWLPDQGSNLDSSEPKSDVLPITPSGIRPVKGSAKIVLFYCSQKKSTKKLNKFPVNMKKAGTKPALRKVTF